MKVERLALLRGEGQQDDQVLETDVMRFVAIIGIVFWIIFALIKSIPFQSTQIDSRLNPPIVEKETTAVSHQPEFTPAEEEEEFRVPARKMEKLAPRRPDLAPSKDATETKGSKSVLPELRGVQMQFLTLDDLLALMASDTVRVFGRAKATGFDIFFEGTLRGKTVGFKGVNSLPSNLWEIKSGKHYTFFLDLLANTYPSIRSFPTREVLVSFVDKELESRVDQAMGRLEQEGENGILSITRAGDVVFQGFDEAF